MLGIGEMLMNITPRFRALIKAQISIYLEDLVLTPQTVGFLLVLIGYKNVSLL